MPADGFRIDSVPEGEVVVTFFHPLLDSAEVGAAPRRVRVVGGSETDVTLSTPSAQTLLESFCGTVAPASGVIVGTVRDVDSGSPIASASVTSSWRQWTIDARGFAGGEQLLSATTDSAGFYRLCGVPADVRVAVLARSGTQISGPLEVDLDSGTFAVQSIGISLRDTTARERDRRVLDSLVFQLDSAPPATGRSSLTGIVSRPDGGPLSGAMITVLGQLPTTTTNDDGRYVLTGLSAGTHTVEVRALGFAPRRRSVDLRTDARGEWSVRLLDAIQVMSEVNIVGARAILDRSGFESRRRSGSGYYLGREAILRLAAFSLPQLFPWMPGMAIAGGNNAPVMRSVWGGFCAPRILVDERVVVDGSPGTSVDDLAYLHPREIRGIEIYPRNVGLPPQYVNPSHRCGTILIWTGTKLDGDGGP